MKKIYLLFLAMLLSFTGFGQVANYSFSKSNGTFTSIAANGVLVQGSEATTTTTLDGSGWTVTMPFTFNFNGVNYTDIYVNSNGGATFGTTNSTSSSVISATTAYSGAIGVMNRDLWGVFITSGVTTTGSNVITNVGSLQGIEIGKLLNNVNGIPAATTVTAFDTTAKTITMSNAATSSSADAVVRYGTGKIFTRTEGTAPNRVFVIEWKGFNDYGSGISDSNFMSFQLRLAETSNTVSIVYGDYFSVNTASKTNQIGLRGATNADFNNRIGAVGNSWNNTTAGTSNSSSVSRDNTNFPVSGLTFTWTPPVICTGTPLGGTVLIPAQFICSGTTPAVISVPNPNAGLSGLTYQWEESDDNGVADPWANVTGGTGATTFAYTPPTFSVTKRYYRLKITCTASGQSGYSTVHTISSNTAPNNVSQVNFTNISEGGLTVNWTNGDGARRVILVNTSNNFSTLPSTGAALTAGTVLTNGDILLYDGTTSPINITGMSCNTTYYFKIIEYVRCGSSPNYNYYYSTGVIQSVTTRSNMFKTPVSLPILNNFVGYSGTNLSTIFPDWEEGIGQPLAIIDSGWTSSTALTVATAKINLFADTKKDWIVSPTLNVNTASRIKFKAAITGYANGDVDPERMQGTDDKVEVMISTDACATTWTPLYTFNATTTTTLTNVLTDFIIDIPSSYVGQNIRIGFKATEGVNDVPDYDFHITAVVIENTPPPTVSISTQINNTCFGGNAGSASALVKDGTSPFTYSWSPSGGTAATATGLAAGTYTVTVTDAQSRTASATVTITEPEDIVSHAVVANVSCNAANNGSITLAPTGGTLPYTYLWSNSATTPTLTGLAPGLYSVTITDTNGCTKTEDITISEPTVLALSGSQVDVSFYGGSDGSATVTATGGTAPYTYSWSPSGGTGSTASNLAAGSYTVTVTDANGCSSTQSFTIVQPIPLMVQSTSQTNVSCNGGSDGTATIAAMGGNAPYTYLWSPSGSTSTTATGLSVGVHTVTITDSTNNTLTESFTITEPLALATTITKTDITCNFSSNGTATVSVTGGTAPYTYFWSNGMTMANASNLNVGTYTVTVTDSKGCKATATVSITQPSALVVTGTVTNISCYGQSDGSASVVVSGGVAPYSYSWSNGQTGTNISSLSKGNYTVTITDANGCITTQSFTIVEPAFVHPPVALNQSFCIGQNATLSNIVITGSNIKWYSTATGGVVLPSTTALTTGTTYYASQTVNGCESSTRTAVQITLNQGTPLTTTQLNVCGNTRIQNVTIDGFNHTQLKWYDSATSATELPISILLTTGTYYVSSVTGTCVSARAKLFR